MVFKDTDADMMTPATSIALVFLYISLVSYDSSLAVRGKTHKSVFSFFFLMMMIMHAASIS